MRRYVTLLLTLIAVLALAGPALAQEHVWKMGYVNATDSSYLKAINTIPDRIARATGGKVKIELHHSLVQGPSQPAALRDGRLEIMAGVNPWLSGEAPILNIGHLPGLILEVSEYKKVLDIYLAEEFKKVWATKYNGVMLSSGIFERQVILSNKPLRKVDDFKGVKVRVHNTEAAQLMNRLGAKPTPIAFPEIVPALQRGVVDAVMTSTGTSHGFGFYTVAKYIHDWKIGTAAGWSVVVNKDAWAKLSPDLQKAVAREFKAIEEAHFADHEPYSDMMTQKQLEKGMTLIIASPDELKKVFSDDNVKAVYDAWYDLCQKNGYDCRRVEAKVREILKR